MILPAQIIRLRCNQPPPLAPLITPFNERTVCRGRSYGLSAAGYDIRIAESVHLKPGEFSLASSMERFNMPLDLLAYVKDKSSWARAGLCVQNTVIEPGWRGYLTLELTNHSRSYVWVKAGDPIAQVVFHRLLMPTDTPYSGKYQDQEPGPQAGRLE